MLERERIQVTKTGQFHGHKSAIYTIAPSPREGHLLSAGSERLVAEWNLETQEATALVTTSAPIFSMQLIPERNLLVLGQEDGGVVFYDFAQQKTVLAIQGHTRAVFDFQVFPNGKYLISSDQSGQIAIWDLDLMQKVHAQKIAEGSIRSMQFSPDGKSLYTGSSDNLIRRFNLDIKLQNQWACGDNSVFRVAVPEDDNRIFAVGRDAHLRSWTITDGFAPDAAIPAHNYAINDIIFQPDGRWLFTGSMDKTIKIWRKSNLELLKVIDVPRNQCHKNGINRLLWMEGKLYSTGDDRLIMEWDLALQP